MRNSIAKFCLADSVHMLFIHAFSFFIPSYIRWYIYIYIYIYRRECLYLFLPKSPATTRM